MKKILLASTILVGSAGIAAAENANFTFSGEANFGVGYNTVTTVFAPEIDSSFTVGMMSTSDMGLEFGASITVGAPGASFESDHTDGAFGTWATNGMSVSDTSVYLSGDWGKLTAAYDADGSDINGPISGIDVYDVTLTYTNTWGDFGVEAYYTMSHLGETNGDLGVKGTYSFGDYSVFAKFDWDADNVNTDGALVNTADWSVTVGAAASMSGFDLAAQIERDNFVADWDWKATASYTTGAYTIGAIVEDDGVDDRIDWGINGSYDLGGGMAINASVIRDQDTAFTLVQAGVSMAF
jgi:outer membrane protein OmpU